MRKGLETYPFQIPTWNSKSKSLHQEIIMLLFEIDCLVHLVHSTPRMFLGRFPIFQQQRESQTEFDEVLATRLTDRSTISLDSDLMAGNM